MDTKTKKELSEHVTKWLEGRGLLGPNQTLKISINIIPATAVEIDTVKYEDDEELTRNLLKKMKPSFATRVYNQLLRHGVSLTMIKSKSLKEIRKYRNVGSKTLSEFADTLTDSGVECLWVKELKAESFDSLTFDKLDISMRTQNCLSNANIKTVGELRRMSHAEIFRSRIFGQASRLEIYLALINKGLDLGWGLKLRR